MLLEVTSKDLEIDLELVVVDLHFMGVKTDVEEVVKVILNEATDMHEKGVFKSELTIHDEPVGFIENDGSLCKYQIVLLTLADLNFSRLKYEITAYQEARTHLCHL